MKKIQLLVLLFLAGILNAQFVSPGNGTSYTLTSLSAAAPTALVNNGTFYQMTNNITISAGDTLLMDENTTLKINSGLVFTIAGTYNTTATNLLITATDPAANFKGFRLESTASVVFKNTTIEYGGGIQSLTGDFLMDNCIVRYQKVGQATGSAISFSTGSPVVTNSQFIENDRPAVSSGATNSVALLFSGNYLQGNTKLNENRPQINMGPSGAGGVTRILNNTVIGNPLNTKVGGIAASSLASAPHSAQIEGNTVKDNRYGITVQGNNVTASIVGNILTDNKYDPNPLTGGSGISLYGNMQVKVQDNEIRGNLWGITLISGAVADMGGGTLGSTGGNIFKNNGNGGVTYALFNNTSNPQSATNNCWREDELSTPAMVEEVINHQVDDPTLGLVTFTPFDCAATMGTNETALAKSVVYPNPSNGNFTLDAAANGNIIITDMSGKLVHSSLVNKGKNNFSLNLKPGVYVLVQQTAEGRQTTKLIIK